MSNLQEIARLVREELLTLIQPVQLLSVNGSKATGEVSGRFRSSSMLFDYSIKGGKVRYRPVGAGGRKDSLVVDHSDSADTARLDAQVLLESLLTSRQNITARAGNSAARRQGYREVVERLDARRGKGRKKNCTKGYSCGNTCIEMAKECVKPAGAAAGRLGAALKTKTAARESSQPTQDQRRIAALVARRDQIGKALVSELSRPRPDGMGNFIEHPDGAAMKRIKATKQRVAKIDRQLNVLEGKDPEKKRWVEGDPYGLSRYSDFQSPGRRAYEQQVIAEQLAAGTKGDQAVFMSGGPASGKTSLLRKQFGEAKGFVVVDPDRIKENDPVMEIGVAMGMRKAAELAHENSSRLSKEVFAIARDNGLNVLMDGTGANAGKYIRQMQELKSKGYQVTLLAQHVPEEVGVKRAMARADRSGRYVPEEFIKHAYEVIPGNFERLAQVADRATLNDGESNQPIMEYEGGRLVGGDRRRTADYRKRYGKP